MKAPFTISMRVEKSKNQFGNTQYYPTIYVNGQIEFDEMKFHYIQRLAFETGIRKLHEIAENERWEEIY